MEYLYWKLILLKLLLQSVIQGDPDSHDPDLFSNQPEKNLIFSNERNLVKYTNSRDNNYQFDSLPTKFQEIKVWSQ